MCLALTESNLGACSISHNQQKTTLEVGFNLPDCGQIDEHFAASSKEHVIRQERFQFDKLIIHPVGLGARFRLDDSSFDLEPKDLLDGNKNHAAALPAHDLPETSR